MVRESGAEQGLEPMSAADRKAVHDTVAEIDGVDAIEVNVSDHLKRELAK